MKRYLAGRALELTCNLLCLELEDLMHKAGIAWPEGGASELMLTAAELRSYHEVLKREYKAEDVALRAVQAAKGHVGHIHGTGELAFLVSKTAGEALRRLAKMKSWIKPEILVFEETAEGLRLTISSADPQFSVDSITELSCFVYIVEALRFHTRQKIPVLAAKISNSIGCKAEIEAMLGCEIEVSKANCLLLGAEIVDIPLNPTSGLRWEDLDEEKTRFEAAIPCTGSLFQAKVRTYVREELIDGVCAERAASAFSISRRTLERRLAKEGTTFKLIVDNVRSELAIKYLKEPGYTSADISYLLGFKEPASFFRAFRRWHDKPPGELAMAAKAP